MSNNDLDFEKAMQQRMNENYGKNVASASEQAVSAKLKEMNKKLPSWNLEPPYTFLK